MIIFPVSLAALAIWLIVIAAIVAVVVVVLRQLGVSIPPFVVTILWIVAAAVLGVLAIRVLAGL